MCGITMEFATKTTQHFTLNLCTFPFQSPPGSHDWSHDGSHDEEGGVRDADPTENRHHQQNEHHQHQTEVPDHNKVPGEEEGEEH